MNRVKRWLMRLCLLPLQILWSAWTTPRTWADPELIDDTIMNQHIRDNLNALKDPPTAQYITNEASDYTTSSASFVDVDSTDLALAITTTGGDVMIGFHGTVEHSSASGVIYFDVTVDGTRLGGDDGLLRMLNPDAAGGGRSIPMTFVVWARSLSAGAHTFKLQWSTASATATLHAGAGTTNKDVHSVFWVREVS